MQPKLVLLSRLFDMSVLPSLSRLIAVCILATSLTVLATMPSFGDAPKDGHGRQPAALEKNITGLQEKLNGLKDGRAPMPRVLPPAEIVIPQTWVNKFQWRGVGPATMGGRITSLAVCESDPSTYWAATASGGLLKTTNNGTTFEHQFDREATVSIGAVAVAPANKEIVWVGTGEANPRNSVSFGDGVYKSADGGKTWKNMGLKTSYQIGDIVVHPTKPDVVYVAALGRLYSAGGERGLFKTEDGGKTWNNILPQLDDKTGSIDIAMHPTNPDILLVAAWERQRDEFDSFRGDARRTTPPGTDEYAPLKVHAGGSAIFKTTDGGKTFTKLSKGLPTVKLGRIGLEWSRKDPKLAFAIVDTEKAGTGKPPKPAPRVFVAMQSETSTGAVKVTSATADGPAAKAGIKEGDLITAIDGKEMKTYEAMIDEFYKREPGGKAKFSVTRGKNKLELELTFGKRPDERVVLGITLGEPAEGGVTVSDVNDNGPAAKAGLRGGDIVVSIDETAIKTRDDVSKGVQGKKAGDKPKVAYIRGKEKGTLEITLVAESSLATTRPHGHPQLGGQNANVQNQQGDDGFQSGGVFKSVDGGETWTRLNSFNPRPFYFSVVKVDPTDDNTLYVLGLDLHRSTDGGKTFKSDGINGGVHSDQHALWINPKDSRHLILGTDGGFYASFDKGAKWDHMSHAGAIGQFYHVAVDNRTPYRIYGGLQDNGSWGGPSRSERTLGSTNFDWTTVQWGDGFICRVDPLDPDVVYAESQDGNITRNNLSTGVVTGIRPQSKPGLQPFRFNWNTPFILSNHNSSIFYSAGNYVFRSFKRGAALEAVSPEITLTKRGTGTALSESPRNADIVWAGTDDGGVWLTRDGCKTWTNLSDKFKSAGLPGPRWVSSIEASKWVDGRCYVVFDAHRSNDDNPYVYVTEDFGQTWKSLRGNLPTGPTRVLREDIANPNLLFLGTEFGCYASIDRGGAWTRINGDKGMPTVAVHEFAQPTTANDLVVATHGRSIWVLDVTPLRQMTADLVRGKTALLSPSPAIQWRQSSPPPFYQSTRAFYGKNPPREAFADYVIGKKAEKATLKVLDVRGNVIRDGGASTEPGYYRVAWELSRGGPRRGAGGIPPKDGNLNPLARPSSNALVPGEYRVILTVDGTEYVQTLTIEADPSMPKLGLGSGDLLGESDEEMNEEGREQERPKRMDD